MIEDINEKDLQVWALLRQALESLKMAKPEERNEKARRYAVTITETEKVVGYFYLFMVGPDPGCFQALEKGIDSLDRLT